MALFLLPLKFFVMCQRGRGAFVDHISLELHSPPLGSYVQSFLHLLPPTWNYLHWVYLYVYIEYQMFNV